MKNLVTNLSLLFSAGVLGGLANSLAVWAFGLLGITALLGVSIAPNLNPEWLYPRLVWGGLWGFIFLLLERKNKSLPFLLSAFLASLGPTFVMLLIVFPLKANKGYLGLELGMLTPLMVVIFNYIWALTTLKIFRFIGKH